MTAGPRRFRSQGDGRVDPTKLRSLGENVIFEDGVRIFHPENIVIGSNVYIGHNTILKGYHVNRLAVADNVWIGQNCFLHAAGGIEIEEGVGIGPGVSILTSEHEPGNREDPVLYSPIATAPVRLCQGCDIGVGAIILPGVTIGVGAVIGAGAVITRDVADHTVAAGVPARKLRDR